VTYYALSRRAARARREASHQAEVPFATMHDADEVDARMT
jgi:hypothetical protein